MAIVEVETPNGKKVKVEAPEGVSDEQILAFAKQEFEKGQGPLDKAWNWVKENAATTGKNVARGAANYAGAIPGTLAAMTPMGQLVSQQVTGTPFSGGKVGSLLQQGAKEQVSNALPIPKDESKPEQYLRSAEEALGGGLLAGPSAFAKAPIGATLSAMGGGLGAQAGHDFGATLDGGDGIMSQIATLLGGIAGGATTGFALGPKLSPGQKRLHSATKEIPDADWQKASENVNRFSNVGTSTATLGEAVPGNGRLLGLSEEVRSSRGGEGLAQRVAKRGEDLSGLGGKFLDRVGPEVDSNSVANSVANSANSALDRLRKANTNTFSRTVQGKNLRASEVADIYATLQKEALSLKNPSTREAYRDIAEQLLDKEGSVTKTIRDVQSLSSRIKEFKDNPVNPRTASAATKHDSFNTNAAVKRAEQLLAEKSPDFKKANERFAQISSEVVDPAKEGPLGRLADKSLLTDPTPASRLNKVIAGNSPQAIQDTVRTLGDKTATMRNPTSPEAVARALLQEKLSKGQTNPGNAVRGQPGSRAEEQIAALISSTKKNPQEVMAPLVVADDLQNFLFPTGVRGQEMPTAVSAALEPSWTGRVMAALSRKTSGNKEIAELLMKPTQENLRKLQEIAKYDPSVRAMLMANSAVVPTMTER